MVAIDCLDVYVDVSIIVIVRSRATHSIYRNIQAGTRCDVRECSVSFISIKSGCRFLRCRTIEVLAVDQEKILKSVIVEVEKQCARAKRFGKIFLTGCPVVVGELNPGLSRDIDELDRL